MTNQIIDSWYKELNKDAKLIVAGNGDFRDDVFLIPTGIFALDAKLGGGIPKNRISLISGVYSGGKSTVTMMLAANAQRFDRFTGRKLEYVEGIPYFVDTGEVCETPMRVLLLDTENTYDEGWARALGVQTSFLSYAQPEYLQLAYEYLLSAINLDEFDLVILDSLAASVPKEEMEANMEQWQRGLAARLNNKGIRVINAALNQVEKRKKPAPAIVFVNQIRKAMGDMYTPSETIPGGEGQKYHASVHLEFRPGKPEEDGGEMYAHNLRWKIIKNKTNGIKGSGEFLIYLKNYGLNKKGTTNEMEQVIDVGLRLNIIGGSKSWLEFNGEKYHGTLKLQKYFIDNPETYTEVKNAVVQAIKDNS